MIPWKRERYPLNWRELALDCKERAGWQCEWCKVVHGSFKKSLRGNMYKVVLAAAHLDHDPENPSPRLAALCQSCHLRYDISRHIQHMRQNRFRRHYAAVIAAGQLELF